MEAQLVEKGMRAAGRLRLQRASLRLAYIGLFVSNDAHWFWEHGFAPFVFARDGDSCRE